MMNEHFWLALAFAAAFTSLFAMLGFNRPSWLRTYTTAARYVEAAVVHMCAYVLLMALVCAVLNALKVRLGLDDRGTIAVEIALFVALVVRGLPWTASRIRAWAHRVAGTPAAGHAYAAALANAGFEPPEQARAQALQILRSRGIDVTQDGLPPARPVLQTAQELTALFVQLRDWEQDRRFRSFLVETGNDFHRLRQGFDRVLLQAARSLATIQKIATLHQLVVAEREADHGHREASTLVKTIVERIAYDMCEELHQFHREAKEFAARGVMASCWTSRSRSSALARLGFQPGDYEPRRSYGMVVLNLALLLFFACWIFVVLRGSSSTGNLDVGVQILLVTLLVASSIGLAAYPIRHWAIANAGIRRRTPVLFVVGTGVAAVLVSIVLSVVVGAVLVGGREGAGVALRATVFMLHSMAMTSMAIAWLAQDHRWGHERDEDHRRVFDGAAFAAVWMVSTVVWASLVSSAGVTGALGLSPQPLTGMDILFDLLFAVVIGGPIGYFLPSSVRRPAPPRIDAFTAPEDEQLVLAEVARLAARSRRREERMPDAEESFPAAT